MEKLTSKITFNKLEWDSEFFGVNSAKTILHAALTEIEWLKLKKQFEDYQFISIVNENSLPINAKHIGQNTSAVLTDVNIQFEKKINKPLSMPDEIEIFQSMKKDDQIIKIADFKISKFIDDPELAKRGGERVYEEWILNSFENPEKFFAISKNDSGMINGFSLFSYTDFFCMVELISVSKDETRSGIGSKLFSAVESTALSNGYNKIVVGTQARNLQAVNFYSRLGYKQYGCHQVFHLWNQEKK